MERCGASQKVCKERGILCAALLCPLWHSFVQDKEKTAQIKAGLIKFLSHRLKTHAMGDRPTWESLGRASLEEARRAPEAERSPPSSE